MIKIDCEKQKHANLWRNFTISRFLARNNIQYKYSREFVCDVITD
jgi:hypothetical protein